MGAQADVPDPRRHPHRAAAVLLHRHGPHAGRRHAGVLGPGADLLRQCRLRADRHLPQRTLPDRAARDRHRPVMEYRLRDRRLVADLRIAVLLDAGATAEDAGDLQRRDFGIVPRRRHHHSRDQGQSAIIDDLRKSRRKAKGSEVMASGVMGRLDGRAIIVTGAGQGIGAAYAKALAAEGARVAVCDLQAPDNTVAVIKQAGGESIGMACDVTDGAAVRRLVEATEQAFGGVQGLVNNAGAVRQSVVQADRSDQLGGIRSGHGGQCARLVRMREGGAAGDAPPALRQDRQHRLGHGVQGDADAAALCDVERRGRRAHPQHRARMRRRRHSLQLPGAGPRAVGECARQSGLGRERHQGQYRQPLHQARIDAGGSPRHAGVSDVRRQRLHDRPDRRGRWRLGDCTERARVELTGGGTPWPLRQPTTSGRGSASPHSARNSSATRRPWYRGEYHLGFTLVFTVGVALFTWYHIHNATVWEWLLIIPFALFGNWAEWAGHRYVLHRPVPGLKMAYKRHCCVHHQFFTNQDLTYRGQKEWRALLFPPFAPVAFILAAIPPALVARLAVLG